MRGEQAIFNLEIKKKSGLSINPDIHHSKVFSSDSALALIFKFKSADIGYWDQAFTIRDSKVFL